jgi:hypothetical protein
MAESPDKVVYALGFIPLTVIGMALLAGLPFLLYLIVRSYFLPQVATYDICNLVPSAPGVSRGGAPISVAPSFWMAQLLFFVGYLLQNAMELYNQPADPQAPESKVRNRREQAITALVITTLVTTAFVAIRYTTGCETAFGMGIAVVTMIPLGVGWYKFASLCGARNADVFGIAGKILPMGASEPAPQVCVNTLV